MNHALRVLEFEKIRELLVSQCENEVARESASEILPSYDARVVVQLQTQTSEAFALLGKESLPSLDRVKDLRRGLEIASKGGTMDAGSLWAVGDSLTVMRLLLSAARAHKEDLYELWPMFACLPELKSLEEKLLNAFDADGEVRDEASAELLRLRRTKKAVAARVIERIQAYTTGKSREYLSDPIYTQREGRYVVPIKSEHRGKIKGIVHDTSSSGQTVFIEPADVVQAGNALREAEAAERAEVARIIAEFSSRVGAEASSIQLGVETSAKLDLIFGKAKLGYAMNACAPRQAPAATLWIRSGRHPLLDAGIAVPLSLELGGEIEALLITGPNTGGKTVSIKTVGLYVAMNQCGMMVPAEDAGLGVFSQIWADIGDEQSLEQSLSTFSGHIKNIAEAAKMVRPGAIVLMDEVGAGTDPAEGAALARSILNYLKDRGAKILASTHYGELKVFAYNTPGFVNAAMEFDTKTLRPTYRLMVGVPGASHALRIAERYGLPLEIVENARQSAGEQEQDVARMLERLEVAQKQAQKAQGEADRLSGRLRQLESETERKLAEADRARREARQKAAETLDVALREIRLEAMDIFDDLKTAYSPAALEKARARLRDLQIAGQELSNEMRPEVARKKTPLITKGMSVKVEGYSATGLVLESPKDGKARIQMGSVKLTVLLEDLIPVASAPTAVKAAPKKNLNLEKASQIAGEIQLIGMRAETAELELSKYVDNALLAGY
ncbi:MAG: endonuclease MutS2, partial [Armatimonadetes bacterium]|nr:endonuclease MutS2 [Armatimonadota bacterium]